jgi:hypothetical protein
MAVAARGAVSAAVPVAITVMLVPILLLILTGAGLNRAQACTPPGLFDANTALRIGTLNWRGASHYRKDPHPGESPYSVRVPYMIAAIESSGASIVGFQEFERPQARAFIHQAGSTWGLVQGRLGSGRPDPRDAIAYRKASWRPVAVNYVAIRYSNPHSRIRIPLTKFTSPHGSSVWVLNTHNPANVVGGSPRIRAAAVRAEAAAVNTLTATDPTTPVLFTGDMNDHHSFATEFMSEAGPGWKAANKNARQIDWIMGGPGVRFTQVVVDQQTNDHAHHYSDHPFVSASIDTTSSSTTVATSDAATDVGTATGRGAADPSAARGPSPAGAPAGSVVAALMRLRLSASSPRLTREQATDAATIARVAAQLGVPERGLQVALVAAIQESKLVNVDYGDRDSLGLFQQRPSQGWGTPVQIMDPALATEAFFGRAEHTDNTGLLEIPDWQSLPIAVAAQQVQRSGYPSAYTAWTQIAATMADLLAGAAGTLPDASGPTPLCPSAAASVPGTAVHGSGPFAPSQIPYVGPFDAVTLRSRMQRIMAASGWRNVDPFFGTQPDGSWYRDCQKFVAILDGRPASGYASAATAWAHFVATGQAHRVGGREAMAPPVGAWLYYGADHVVVYLGANLVAGTDTWGTGTAKIGPASDISGGIWHLPYRGWVAPWG